MCNRMLNFRGTRYWAVAAGSRFVLTSRRLCRTRVSRMSEKPESDEFEEEEPDEPLVGDSDVDLDQVAKELDMAKRRGQKVGDPAWRRLERLLEDKRTAELTSDFEDYDIGLDDDEDPSGRAQR
jgi:hypothetical protein